MGDYHTIIITSITINVIIGVIMMIIRSSNKEGGVASKGLILTDRGHRSPNQPSMPLFFTVLVILISIIATLLVGNNHLAQVMMSVKLCVQLEDFKENVISAFGSLRNDKEFTNVTLACEDGQQMEAHKGILAASSPFFQKILQKNKHPHPLIYLKGFQSKDFVSILDFLYLGEANVYQDDLDSFLAIAEEIQLKGLTNESSKDLIQEQEEIRHPEPIQNDRDLPKQSASPYQDLKRNRVVPNTASTKVAIPNQSSTDLQVLDEKVKSMMERGQKMIPNSNRPDGTLKKTITWICNVCGKEGLFQLIRDHIEANHLEGISLSCDSCDKTCPSRASLKMHKFKFHK